MRQEKLMRGKNTILINGKVYDSTTGLPVAEPVTSQKPSSASAVRAIVPKPVIAPAKTVIRDTHHAKQTHRHTQKSTTLRRDVLKKPVSKSQIGSAKRTPTAGHVARSPHISKFAPHPQVFDISRPKRTSVKQVSTESVHPIVAQKHALVTPPKHAKPQAMTSRELKNHLIKQGLEKSNREQVSVPKRKGFFARRPRAAGFATMSIAVMVLGGYLTYLNMPGLSVRVAAAQAGVAASFPDYHPDGYRFNGPVAYSPGQVAIKFQANSNSSTYTLSEQNSGWNSQAVFDNVIAKLPDSDYITNSQQGLTIYTFGSKAAWVNRGILYTVDGDAPLNNEQLLKIAGSL